MTDVLPSRDAGGDVAGTQRAIKTGVKSIDHNCLADNEAIKMMAEHGVLMSVQVLTPSQIVAAYPGDDVRFNQEDS